MDTQTTQQQGEKVHQFQFHGSGGDLLLLILKNLFLTVITLGIYAAWARAERRKFLWSNTEISGQRLVFSGTGWELFKGYLKLVCAYLVFIFTPVAMEKLVPGSRVPVQLLLGLGLVIIIPFAIYWSRAYLLSRTQWRGIRFGLTPGAGEYAKTFIGGYFLTLVTFGLYYFWYSAQMQRYTFENIEFMGARGRSTLSGGDMLAFTLVGGLAVTFTLGLAFPWVLVWVLNTTFSRVSFVGDVDFRLVAQRAQTGDAASDALAGELGVDLAL